MGLFMTKYQEWTANPFSFLDRKNDIKNLKWKQLGNNFTVHHNSNEYSNCWKGTTRVGICDIGYTYIYHIRAIRILTSIYTIYSFYSNIDVGSLPILPIFLHNKGWVKILWCHGYSLPRYIYKNYTFVNFYAFVEYEMGKEYG